MIESIDLTEVKSCLDRPSFRRAVFKLFKSIQYRVTTKR